MKKLNAYTWLQSIKIFLFNTTQSRVDLIIVGLVSALISHGLFWEWVFTVLAVVIGFCALKILLVYSLEKLSHHIEKGN